MKLSRSGEYFFLQEGTRGIRVATRDRALPAAGEAVEAVGFVEMRSY